MPTHISLCLVGSEKMILEEETFERFGYYPSDLKPKSRKKILAACDDCGKIRVISKQDYRSLCPSCSRKGERSPMFGRTGESNPMFGRTGEKHPMFGITGEKSPGWKGGLVKRTCDNCGKEFGRNPSDIKQSGGRFCSYKCRGKWQSKHLRGQNSHSWKGGRSFKTYCEKFDEPFREYIREKFDRICFLCPKTEAENGRKLSVHHVNYDKDCLCDDNLTCQFVPLCKSCHARVNFNREKWEKKINDMLHNTLKGWYI